MRIAGGEIAPDIQHGISSRLHISATALRRNHTQQRFRELAPLLKDMAGIQARPAVRIDIQRRGCRRGHGRDAAVVVIQRQQISPAAIRRFPAVHVGRDIIHPDAFPASAGGSGRKRKVILIQRIVKGRQIQEVVSAEIHIPELRNRSRRPVDRKHQIVRRNGCLQIRFGNPDGDLDGVIQPVFREEDNLAGAGVPAVRRLEAVRVEGVHIQRTQVGLRGISRILHVQQRGAGGGPGTARERSRIAGAGLPHPVPALPAAVRLDRGVLDGAPGKAGHRHGPLLPEVEFVRQGLPVGNRHRQVVVERQAEIRRHCAARKQAQREGPGGIRLAGLELRRIRHGEGEPPGGLLPARADAVVGQPVGVRRARLQEGPIPGAVRQAGGREIR